jgi:hypothetical protein
MDEFERMWKNYEDTMRETKKVTTHTGIAISRRSAFVIVQCHNPCDPKPACQCQWTLDIGIGIDIGTVIYMRTTCTHRRWPNSPPSH